MRADRLIMLHNYTRIIEKELLEVLEAAKIPYVDFTARRGNVGTRDYMEIYIELKDSMPEVEVAKRINERFVEVDRDWRIYSSSNTPLRVQIIPKGGFHRYLASRRTCRGRTHRDVRRAPNDAPQ
jgi:hypothetical protein